MAIRCKVDILAALSAAGYSSYRLRREKIMGESTRTKIRAGGLPSWHELDVICRLLQCQPGDLVEYVDDHAADDDDAVIPTPRGNAGDEKGAEEPLLHRKK